MMKENLDDEDRSETPRPSSSHVKRFNNKGGVCDDTGSNVRLAPLTEPISEQKTLRTNNFSQNNTCNQETRKSHEAFHFKATQNNDNIQATSRQVKPGHKKPPITQRKTLGAQARGSENDNVDNINLGPPSGSLNQCYMHDKMLSSNNNQGDLSPSESDRDDKSDIDEKKHTQPHRYNPRPSQLEKEQANDSYCILFSSQQDYSPTCPSKIPSKRTLFTLPLADVVSALHISPFAISFGTLFGKVIIFKFNKPLNEVNNNPYELDGFVTMVTTFSDDAIRWVYTDSRKLVAVVGNSQAYEWILSGLENPKRSRSDPKHIKFDSRISPLLKYVLNRGSKILIASMGATVVYDLDENVQWLCPLRLPDYEVVPMDFMEDRMVAIIHRLEASGPSLKVLRLPLTRDEPEWGVTVECVFHQDLVKTHGVAAAKLWGEDLLVFITRGRTIHVYQISTGEEVMVWKGHRSDICLLDATNPERIVTISEDSMMHVWILSKESSVISLSLSPDKFDLGNQYSIASWGNLIVYSSDGHISSVLLPRI